MSQVSSGTRLKALDGIRGLAILAVFLNHIEPTYAFKILPSFLYPFGSVIFSSGVLGVSFLFVLSGFLMAYIYPHPKSELWFLQKRYTRIFPLFLTMSLVVLILRVFPKFLEGWGFGLILLLAGLVHLVWMYGTKRMFPQFKKTLFILFLLIQIFAGAFYAFWIMRHSPIVFNQQFSPLAREGIIGLINSTLTLPLGNYIPMLDGVYWSLAAEILFYVLYPILCVPVINFLIPQKKYIKYLFLITLLPLVGGADMLSRRILGLGMLQLPLFYCFVTGMVLGYLYHKKPNIVGRLTGIFRGWMSFSSIIFFFGTVYLYHMLLDKANPALAPWMHIASAVPLALIIAIALDKRNALSRMFSSKLLVFFGIISYSIYLSHSTIIHMAKALYQPTDVPTTAVFILSIFLATIIVSGILYILLERPYFLRPKEAKLPEPLRTQSYALRPAFLALGVLIIIYLFATFDAYQSNFNLFSTEHSAKMVITSQIKNKGRFISMQENPTVDMQIYSQNNNLGIIAMHLIHKTASNSTYSENNLTFSIKEKGAKNWYATSSYKLMQIGDSYSHPFGFPPIDGSKGKTYDIELKINPFLASDYALVDTSENSIRTVYPVSKAQLLTNPIRLISFAQARDSSRFF